MKAESKDIKGCPNCASLKGQVEADAKAIRLSDDVWVKMEGVSAFTIYMKNDEGGMEIVELLEAELKAIRPLIRTYLHNLADSHQGSEQA
jgi:hypothetical protein